MASRLESSVVYAAGAVQGIVLVTFPAASTIFTTDYGLSNTRYGMLFLPQVVLAVLASLLGVGTVLAPLFVAIFVRLGFWWGLPIVSVVLLVAILAVSLGLALSAPRSATGSGRLPARFAVYAGFAVLYGICETLNGNWAQADMTAVHHASTQRATWALTAFWAMVALGRVFFALARRIKPEWTYHGLPFALAAVFLLIAALPAGSRLRGGGGVRPGRARLLGAAAADDQLRAGGDGRGRGGGRGRSISLFISLGTASRLSEWERCSTRA